MTGETKGQRGGLFQRARQREAIEDKQKTQINKKETAEAEREKESQSDTDQQVASMWKKREKNACSEKKRQRESRKNAREQSTGRERRAKRKQRETTKKIENRQGEEKSFRSGCQEKKPYTDTHTILATRRDMNE